MRLISGSIAAPLLVLLGIACNTVSPDECWINTSGGFGGSGTIPIGAGVGATSGDYIDPPRGPLDNGDIPNPCIMASNPCDQKCLDDYEVSAIGCSKIENEAQRKTCQDGTYASYRSCHGTCLQQSRDCDEKYQDCQAHAPASCLKRSGGKSLCQRCLERCNAGDSPSGACRTCKF